MSSDHSSEGRYVICQHPEHSAVAEIFAIGEYRRIARLDDGYRILHSTDTWDEAVEWLRQTIEAICGRDPLLTNLKQEMEAELW